MNWHLGWCQVDICERKKKNSTYLGPAGLTCYCIVIFDKLSPSRHGGGDILRVLNKTEMGNWNSELSQWGTRITQAVTITGTGRFSCQVNWAAEISLEWVPPNSSSPNVPGDIVSYCTKLTSFNLSWVESFLWFCFWCPIKMKGHLFTVFKEKWYISCTHNL